MNQTSRSWNPSERQTVSFSGDSRYLSLLQVYSREKRDLCNLSQSESMGLELGAIRIDPVYQNLQDKITAALKLLTFRNPHVIVQFYSPHVIKKDQTLTAVDQPFGLGVVDHEGLCTYRLDSERNSFLVDKDPEEEDHSPVARVFRRGFPEWTTDINNYTLKQFPQQACAIRCGLHGYLGLPVFDSAGGSCVGVIEILTSSKYMSYAFEVQQLHNALKMVDLRTHQAFGCPTLNRVNLLLSPQVFDFTAQMNAPNGHRQKDFDKIFNILKKTCDLYSLPLAQTWKLSQHCSYVAHESVIEKSCSSFESRCVGKECMSRAGLPFHVEDMRMWSFFKASTEQHLEKSHGLVGKALLTRGSYFCEDVTRLGEEEYPLVHNARMYGLTSCFAIFLQSVEAGDEYVLEFYLPPDMKEIIHVLNMVQTLKQKFEIASGFELGDSSSIQVVGPPTDLFANMVSDVTLTQTSSDCAEDNIMNLMYSSDSKSVYSSDSESVYSSDSESVYSSVTEIVTARITFNVVRENVQFPMSSGLAYLKNEVARIFELEGEIRLTYLDDDNDEILIPCDEDLEYALKTAGNNNIIDLICMPGP